MSPFDAAPMERDLSLSQWFTPPDVAAAVARFARIRPGDRVLEPAAGEGALVRAAVELGAVVEAWDCDRRCVPSLKAAGASDIVVGDFMRAMPPMRPRDGGGSGWDLALANTPYEDGQDVAFVLHGFRFVPRYVGIFRSAIVHGDERYERLWRWTDITRGKWLRKRPRFGRGKVADTARSDFVVLELVARARARKLDEDMHLVMGWL